MDGPWIDIGGFALHAPVTVATNLVLAVQCALAFVFLRGSDDERGRSWGRFFLLMAVATLAGAVKHGARHLLVDDALLGVMAICNVATAVSTYFAQRASIATHGASRRATVYHGVAAFQLGAFATVNIVYGPDLMLLIASTVVGLVPVLLAEAVHHRRLGSGSIALGLGVSLASGLTYVFRLSAGPWLNHVDIAHLVMSASLLLVYRGAARPGADSWI